jgi:hypothetical protein
VDNITTNLNVSLVKSEMRDKAGVDAATFGQEDAHSDHSKGGKKNDSLKSDKTVQDK